MLFMDKRQKVRTPRVLAAETNRMREEIVLALCGAVIRTSLTSLCAADEDLNPFAGAQRATESAQRR